MTKPPNFVSIDEEIKQLEEQDSSPYWDELEAVDFKVNLHTDLLHPRLVVLTHKPVGSQLELLRLEAITITCVTHFDGQLVVIRAVPAYRSRTNGREYILEATLDKIEHLLDLEQTNQLKPVDTLQVPVFDLQASG